MPADDPSLASGPLCPPHLDSGGGESRALMFAALTEGPPGLARLRRGAGRLAADLRGPGGLRDANAAPAAQQFLEALLAASGTIYLTGSPGAGRKSLLRWLTPALDLAGHPASEGAEPLFPITLTLADPARLASAPLTPTAPALRLAVLAADRLLGSVDLNLIRLLRQDSAAPLILFINQIDRLDDPALDLPEIEARLRAEAGRQNGVFGAVPQVIFGSLAWAQAALRGALGDLPAASKEALLSYAALREDEGEAPEAEDTPAAHVWRLAGLPALWQAIDRLLVEGALAGQLARLTRQFQSVRAPLPEARGDEAPMRPLATAPRRRPAPHTALPLPETLRQAETLGRDLLAALESEGIALQTAFRTGLHLWVQEAESAALFDMARRAGEGGPLPAWHWHNPRLDLRLHRLCRTHALACQRLGERQMKAGTRAFAALASAAHVPRPAASLSSESKGREGKAPAAFARARAAADSGLKGPAAKRALGWQAPLGHSRTAQIAAFRRMLSARLNKLEADLMRWAEAGPMEGARNRCLGFLRRETEALMARARGEGQGLKAPRRPLQGPRAKKG